jgi:IgA Peptidase M64
VSAVTTADGRIIGPRKIVDHGPNAKRYNIVILGDGYRQAELAKYAADVNSFVAKFKATVPFDKLWPGINIHRVDVTSVDSGADDPRTCGDGSIGTGKTAKTYFDSTFCTNGIRRLLTCNVATAKNVAQAQVPQVHMTMVIVNTTEYGGSGGQVATFSTAPNAEEIGLHEMGHTAFGFADEYEYYQGCGSGEVGHDHFSGGEPVEPNVTAVTDKTKIKWKTLLTSTADALPTTANMQCSDCDPQPNPKAATYVGAYDGARYFHCGCYRPSFNCRMRALNFSYCAVCQQVIMKTLAPFLPPANVA